MTELSGFPSTEAQITRDGALHRPEDRDRLLELVTGRPQVTDLLVLVHGWNNDMKQARRLYADLASGLAAELGDARRGVALLGVLWPSKKFAERDLIPSGAASATGGVSDEWLRDRLAEFEAVLAGELVEDEAEAASAYAASQHRHVVPELAQVEALLPDVDDDPKAREQVAETIRGLLSRDAADAEDASAEFFRLPPGEVVDRLSPPSLAGRRPLPQSGSTGGVATTGTAASVPAGATGGAAGLGDALAGARAGVLRLLNYSTYYVMKDRAGRVGRGGVADLLEAVRQRRPDLRLHLVGHSFGARVVTAAVAAADLVPPVSSLVLLQGAFSHNGFGRRFDGVRDGAFRSVLDARKVSGPLVVTCTVNDRAVGLAYPLASRLMQQDASGLGDRSDRFGGIGRNGALYADAVEGRLLAASASYAFQPGRVHNLVGDDVIRDHGDVTGPEVVHAVAAAMGTR